MRRYRGMLLSLLLLGIGLFLCIVFNPTLGIEFEAIAINLNAQRHLVSRIYTPKTTPTPQPVMILCHGINNSKEMMAPLAVELARHGIAAIAFDFGGFGESYQLPAQLKSLDNLEANTLADAQAVLAFVRRHPERFDPSRIGIGGHSMGGNTALKLARMEPQLRATVLFSISGEATPTIPANLFLGVGAYEQLNPPQELRLMLKQATESNSNCLNGNICGDFRAGTARQLFISPTTDHVTAPYDPRLIQQVVNWTQRALDVPVISNRVKSGSDISGQPLAIPWFIFGAILTFSGGIAFGVYLLLQTNQPSWLMGVQIAVLWGLGASRLMSTDAVSNLMLFCLFLQLCSNYARRYPEKVIRGVRVASLYSLLFLGAFVLPALLLGIREIMLTPAYLVYIPQFLLQWGFFLFYNYAQTVKLALFSAYTFALTPSWLFWLLVLLELILPGVTLTVIDRSGRWLVRWLRSPFRLGIGKFYRQDAGVLAGLLILLGIILYLRSADRFLSVAMSMGILALKLFGLLALLPLLVIVFSLRSPWFRRLESWLGVA
ncbi:MAG: alpha/beta hydrolase [Xenococcaceae cyanobacterium]